MNAVVNILKNNLKLIARYIDRYKFLLVLCVLSVYLRFSYNLPVLLMPDSPKYFVPLSVIQAQDLDWVLSTINFGLLNKIISFFVQSFDDGSIAKMITLQKICGIISTLILYFIAVKLTQGNRLFAFILALFFTIDPQMLYIEQVLMPEALFICLSLLASFFFLTALGTLNNQDVTYFRVSDEGLVQQVIKHKRIGYAHGFLSGLTVGLASLAKEVASPWSMAIICVLVVVGLYRIVSQRSSKLLFVGLIFTVGVYLIRSPIMFYNLIKHHSFTSSLYSTSGGLFLWSLSEEMVRHTFPKKQSIIRNALIKLTDDNKLKFNIPTNLSDSIAFHTALIALNVQGREGELMDSRTGKKISSQQWSKMCFEYWLSVIIDNPAMAIKRIFIKSFADLFLTHNLSLFEQRRAGGREGTDYEYIQFLPLPFSSKTLLDPKLQSSKLVTTENLTEKYFYKDSTHRDYYKNFIVIMVDRKSNKAFLFPQKGLSLWIQKTFIKVPWGLIVLPIFLFAFYMFFLKGLFKKADLFAYYLLGSSLFYSLLPLLTHSEPRYRLQFIHFMLLFSAYVLHRFFIIKRPGAQVPEPVLSETAISHSKSERVCLRTNVFKNQVFRIG